MRRPTDPSVIALALVSKWARKMGLPAGNLWEPAIYRHMEKEAAALGNDANAWAHTIALMAIRLGVDL